MIYFTWINLIKNRTKEPDERLPRFVQWRQLVQTPNTNHKIYNFDNSQYQKYCNLLKRRFTYWLCKSLYKQTKMGIIFTISYWDICCYLNFCKYFFYVFFIQDWNFLFQISLLLRRSVSISFVAQYIVSDLLISFRFYVSTSMTKKINRSRSFPR